MFVMRSAVLCSAMALATPAAFACKPGVEHRKLDQAALQNIQKNQVNTGKEMWRLEAQQVASREAAALDPGHKGAPDRAPVKFLKGDERTQIFQYKAADGRTFELTLKKPEWLLPYAGIYKMEMWVVTDVKTTCGK